MTRLTLTRARPTIGPPLLVAVTAAVSVLLWVVSLGAIDVRAISDLGLISEVPPLMLVSVVLIGLVHAIAVRIHPVPAILGAVPVVLLIVVVHGLPLFVEDAPSFAVAYLHAGFTDTIEDTGSLLVNVDARFSWPVFFSLGALVTAVADIANAVQLQPWSAVVSNLLYLIPLVVIFSSLTADTRLIWTAAFFFYAASWVGQDYYAPQNLNFLLYLTVLAVVLHWFRTDDLPGWLSRLLAWIDRQWPRLRRSRGVDKIPDDHPEPAAATPRERAALLAVVIVLAAVSVASHQLTPFAMLAALTGLTLFRRVSLRGLAILIAVLAASWISYMTVAFLAGNLQHLLEDLGAAGQTASENVVSRVSGSAGHVFVVQFRLAMTLALWALAAFGALRRFRHGQLDVEAALLAAMPFGLMLLQAYGGEMLLRVYLFSLPFMAFLAAGAFFPARARPTSARTTRLLAMTAAILCLTLMVTRHGNERADAITGAEVAAADRLYAIAPPGSTLASINYSSPLRSRDFELYDHPFVQDPFLTLRTRAVMDAMDTGAPCRYLFISRTQAAAAGVYDGVTDARWTSAMASLLASGEFEVLFRNEDAIVLGATPVTVACRGDA